MRLVMTVEQEVTYHEQGTTKQKTEVIVSTGESELNADPAILAAFLRGVADRIDPKRNNIGYNPGIYATNSTGLISG